MATRLNVSGFKFDEFESIAKNAMRAVGGDPDREIYAAIDISQTQSQRLEIVQMGWKIRALFALAKRLEKKLPQSHSHLIRYLCEGRSVFGNRIEPTPAYYGYLLRSEVQELRKFLTPYKPPQTVPKKFVGYDPEFCRHLQTLGLVRTTSTPTESKGPADDYTPAEENSLEKCLSRWLYEIDTAEMDCFFCAL